MHKKFWYLKVCLPAALCLLIVSVARAQEVQATKNLNVWTKNEVKGDGESGTLIEVRAAKHKDFDRVVFEFKDDLPPYKVSYQNPPFFLNESDEKVEVTGDKFLQVSFMPAYGYDTVTGQPTVSRDAGKLSLPVVQETAFIYNHEALIIFIVGTKRSTTFRVTELRNPARLAIDFKH